MTGVIRQLHGTISRVLRREQIQTPSAAHTRAQQHWRGVSDTFHADEAYYQQVEAALSARIIPRIGPHDRVLDVGCGNGRYTLSFAQRAASVVAYDLSPTLIDQAREAARTAGASNVEFDVGDVSNMPVTDRYELVVCMGVLVCLIDQHAFDAALDALARAVAPGGRLLLRESLSGWGKLIWRGPHYTACYRRFEHYRKPLGRRGFVVEERTRIAVWSRWRRRSNWLLCFRKPPL